MGTDDTTHDQGGQPEAISATRRPPSRRRTRTREYRKLMELRQVHQQLQRRFVASAVALGLLSIGLGGWALRETHLRRDLMTTRYSERSELRAAHEELAEATATIDGLVQGRIPNLHPVAFDEVMPMGESYVRNVAFTLLREGDALTYEYKLVLQNETDIMVHPSVELLMFDRLGVQMGRASVGSLEEGDAAVDAQTLYPGEVRSYAGPLDVTRNVEPAYFLLEAR